MNQDSEEETKNNPDSLVQPVLARAQELESTGFEFSQAHDTAWLEHRISQWPEKWGDKLEIIIYGDFQPPKNKLGFDSLGITIFPEKLENTVARSALYVLKAVVDIDGKNVSALQDASKRINTLLGSWVLVSWGISPCGWWSWVTHGTGGGGSSPFQSDEIEKAVSGILGLPVEIKERVDSALYWVREPGNLIKESYRRDVLRKYVAYWNAFECLVEAYDLIKPNKKLSKPEKQKKIDEYFLSIEGNPTPLQIDECYKTIVNPGFKAKACNALIVSFEEGAEKHIKECFGKENKDDSLYSIRNAINHGEVDAENIEELIRIDARLSKLRLIVWGMFGRLIPFSAPASN